LINNSEKTFVDFVNSQPPSGLGSDLKTLENILLVQTRSDDVRDAATAREALEIFGSKISDIDEHDLEALPESVADKVKNEKRNVAPRKNYALLKLEREKPELHNQVVAGQLSLNKALIDAGFRERRFSISLDSVEKAASTIRHKLSDAQIQTLVQQLQQRL
jgi:hypothetical protein